MVQKGLTGFFEKFLRKDSIFLDKKPLQSSHMPNIIFYRDEQIEEMANILAPAIKLEKPSNTFIYGKTGTGKTLTTKYTIKNLVAVAKENDIPLVFVYINCKLQRVADTEYRLIAQLARKLGKIIPPTGLPTDEVYNIFYNVVDEKKQLIIFVLDEIDQLVKRAGDEVLYNLTRINTELKNAEISLIGISNDLLFADHLDTRVKSSLSEEEIIFPPYNAIQLQKILKERSKKAFKPESITEGVIEKCAAYAAREHGDARRALELLRVAGEIADRKGLSKLKLEHIDIAEDTLEKDRLLDITISQPKQVKAVLYSILLVCTDSKKSSKNSISTGDIYDIYRGICVRSALRPLTQRRISDILSELDMLGIIQAKLISKGRYGRTRELSLTIPSQSQDKIKELLEEGLELS